MTHTTSIVSSLTKFTRREIDQLFKSCRPALRTHELTLLKAPATQDRGRILIIIKRHIGNAPQRNKLRRRLKAIFYEQGFYSLGYDLIVIAKKGAAALEFIELEKLLQETFIQ